MTQTAAVAETRRERRGTDRNVEVSRALWAAGLVGALATLLISVAPSLSFAYRSEAAHAAIETAAFLVAAVAATLVAGRALRSGARSEVLLAASLGTLAITNLGFSLIPSLTGGAPQFSSWGGLAGRLVGAALFAAAALAPERRLGAPSRSLRNAALAVVVGLGALMALVGVLAGSLPAVIDPTLSPEDGNRVLVGNGFALAAQGVMLVLYAAAAAGFARRARLRGDRLLAGFAAAAVLSAFARLNYLLFPSLYSEWVYTGDLLRLAHYLLILVVVAVELLEYQRRASVLAVLDERRRVARELHDGLAQELVFIRTEATRLRGVEGGRAVVSAADRAIEEARAAIAMLNRPLDEPLADALRHSAQSVAQRAGAKVEVTEQGDVTDVGPDVRHALLRLVREATGNAVKHGGAQKVRISVTGGDGLRVDIADDGSGFDTSAPRRDDAFGLMGMQERAEALGGSLDLVSQPGEGTTVTVRLP